MPLPNIFEQQTTEDLIERLNKLTPHSKPLWGKMAVGEMLAHCNVAYELNLDHSHPKPNVI